jgi:hypothetical protein
MERVREGCGGLVSARAWLLVALACLGAAACGATSEQRVPLPSQEIELTRPELCRIYVFRSRQPMGSARELRIYDQDTEIGSLAGDEYLCWERPAGHTLIRAVYEGPEIDRGQQEDLYDFTAVSGAVQYFVVGLRKESEHTAFGKKRGSPLLTPVDVAEGRELRRTTKPAG